MITPSITDTQVVTALRTFILGIVSCEVIREQVNRVAMPAGDFVALNLVAAKPLATNTDTYDTTQSTKSVLRPTQVTIQVDCYGATAGENAQAIASLLRDDYAVQSFIASGYDVAPLYAGDAQQMPLITGEEQYLQRWTFKAELQYNPILVVPQQFETVAPVVNLIEVDSTYPPS